MYDCLKRFPLSCDMTYCSAWQFPKVTAIAGDNCSVRDSVGADSISHADIPFHMPIFLWQDVQCPLGSVLSGHFQCGDSGLWRRRTIFRCYREPAYSFRI